MLNYLQRIWFNRMLNYFQAGYHLLLLRHYTAVCCEKEASSVLTQTIFCASPCHWFCSSSRKSESTLSITFFIVSSNISKTSDWLPFVKFISAVWQTYSCWVKMLRSSRIKIILAPNPQVHAHVNVTQQCCSKLYSKN